MPETIPTSPAAGAEASSSAALDFLARRYALPPERYPEVRRLIEAQSGGGTALRLEKGTQTRIEDWGQAATSSSAAADVARPLVLGSDDGEGGGAWLQSWRYFAAERAIARALIERAGATVEGALPPSQAVLQNEWRLNEAQARAVRMAVGRRLALITGGPGTGKTHTLARLLAALMPEQGAPLDIRLAAPTGKAADRMREAIVLALGQLPEPLRTRVAEPLGRAASGACTLHKLLGHNPATGRCAFNERRPLPAHLVIVDECSMVDTLLWQALLAALHPDTRLVLLGDPNQLESVSAGDVLGSIVRSIQKLGSKSALAACWVELVESRRFRDQPEVGVLARAIIEGRPDSAWEVLRAGAEKLAQGGFSGGVAALGEPLELSWSTLPDPIREAISTVADAATPAEALRALERVRILTAHREGRTGAAGVNAWIGRELKARASQRGRNSWFSPIIINRNDAETGLKNGSVGVRVEGIGVQAKAWFPAEESGAAPREFELARLPEEHAPAWAMTIHRSQGSEFEHVGVVLPTEAKSPLATRELLYTAITRTKRAVYLWGSEATLAAALKDRSRRCTLLGVQLARCVG